MLSRRTNLEYPQGFYSYTKNIGIKDKTLDFAVIYSDVLCQATAVFFIYNFPGAPIIVGKEHIQNGKLQAIVINSKNANVATGERGIQDSKNICKTLADSLGIDEKTVLPSSTGVIGVPLPIEKILNACKDVKNNLIKGSLESVAQAIMTTDKKPKIFSKKIYSNISKKYGLIYGIAKGAGMIEPNMATMLCYILTDFNLPQDKLYSILKKSVDYSFNCLSIDSDTSTSDTVALLCSGYSGEIEESEFRVALDEVCQNLVSKIAADGEGATKLILLDILSARDELQARKIGKSILNSPLIKTAVYGGDPNWGRIIMAIGKVFDEKIQYENLQVRFGNIEVKGANPQKLIEMANYLKQNTEINIQVELKEGDFSMRFWGCDLTEGYVQENAYYTT